MKNPKYNTIHIDRRTFLKNSTLATAGLATYISSVSAMGSGQGYEIPEMPPERFFPIAAINDTIHLLQLEGELSDTLKQALTARPDLARMGSLTARRSGSLSGFLTKLKTAGSQENDSLAHLAMIAGAAMFSGVEQVLGKLHTNKANESTEKAIYHDVAVLQGISEGSKGALNLDGVSEQEVISIFEMMWHRSLIKLHTTKPDLTDTQAWILRFSDFVENQKEVYKAYAAAYLKKKPDQYEKYVVRPNIYNVNDDLLTILRSPEKKLFGSNNAHLKQALNQKNDVSVYTQSILQAYDRMHRLNGFWKDERYENEVADIFD